MSNSISDYFAALERLKLGCTIRVPVGTLISNDSVSLEAGRRAGSIKRSREIFADLIVAIQEEQRAKTNKKSSEKQRLLEVKAESAQYRTAWEESIARELSLIREVGNLKAELVALRGGTVLPLVPRPEQNK